jgi:hypothetical protein
LRELYTIYESPKKKDFYPDTKQKADGDMNLLLRDDIGGVLAAIASPNHAIKVPLRVTEVPVITSSAKLVAVRRCRQVAVGCSRRGQQSSLGFSSSPAKGADDSSRAITRGPQNGSSEPVGSGGQSLPNALFYGSMSC